METELNPGKRWPSEGQVGLNLPCTSGSKRQAGSLALVFRALGGSGTGKCFLG